MKYGSIALALLTLAPLSAATKPDKDVANRLEEAGTVFTEVMKIPEKGIPEDLLAKAHCAVIIPGLKKGAFIVGAKYGKGFITCRHETGVGWSAPGAVRVEGGSVGFQIGGAEIDVILLVMNERGADRLLSSQFTLGGEGEVAAGPVGRAASASTDAKFTAEMLSWSRSRGVFAGVSLQGATLRQDLEDNAKLYGREIPNKEIVDSKMAVPESAKPLITALNHYSHVEQH